MGIRHDCSSSFSLVERKNEEKHISFTLISYQERADATLCVRFKIILSARDLKLALRVSDSQAFDFVE